MAHFLVGPPSPRHETFDLRQESDDARLRITVLAPIDSTSSLELFKLGFDHGPAPPFGGPVRLPIWRSNDIHLVGSVALSCHWQSAPALRRIGLSRIVWIAIYLRLLFIEEQTVPTRLKRIRRFAVNDDI